MILYHYPKCSTSRKALKYLEDKGLSPEIRLYMKDNMEKKELVELLNTLGVSPIKILRTNNSVYKEQIAGKDLSDKELIDLMIEHPGIIQRAILVNGNKAVLARPIENMEEIL